MTAARDGAMVRLRQRGMGRWSDGLLMAGSGCEKALLGQGFLNDCKLCSAREAQKHGIWGKAMHLFSEINRK